MMGEEVVGPVFPLTREQFEVALVRGLGRAQMHVARHGAKGLEDLILDSCLHNRAYDAQCECERAGWVFDLVLAAGLSERVLAAVVEELHAKREPEHRHAEHACGLARRFAAQGHAVAREALYFAFRRTLDQNDQVGVGEIIALDGETGLVFVVESLGEKLRGHPEEYVDDQPLFWFEEHRAPAKARAVLESAAVANEAVRRYLKRLDDLKARRSEPEPSSREASFIKQPTRWPSSLEEMIRCAELPPPMSPWLLGRRWGRQATEDELRTIIHRLEAAADPGVRRRYIGCFLDRPLPAAGPILLRLADDPDADVRRSAIWALRGYPHEDVRAFALRRLAAGRADEGEVALLRRNYQSGDHEHVEPILRAACRAGDMHSLGMDVLEAFKGNRFPAARDCLLLVYDNTPCSNCRGEAVEWLVEQGVAPEWVLDEGRFDVDPEIRALCGGAKVG